MQRWRSGSQGGSGKRVPSRKTGTDRDAGWKPECVRIQNLQSQHQGAKEGITNGAREGWSVGKLGGGEDIELELREFAFTLVYLLTLRQRRDLAQGHTVDKE